MSILSVSGLVKVYSDGTIALKGVDIYYDSTSSIIALVGPNGAGKTTLLRILGGQLRPSKGSIELFGIDVIKDPGRATRIASFLPQDIRAPFLNLTPFDYIVSYLMIRGYSFREARRRARYMADLMDLGDTTYKPVSKLSGGMIKRAMVAAVLADEEARVYLLDEPLPGLDPRSRLLFWEVLRKVLSGSVAIVSSHYTEDLPFTTNHVIVLNKGYKVVEGSPSQVLEGVLKGCLSRVVIRVEPAKDYKWLVEEVRELACRVVMVSDGMVIAYTDRPGAVVDVARRNGYRAEASPASIGDVVLALEEVGA